MATYSRECLSVGCKDGDVVAVLVVSTDEERVSFRSDVFEFDALERPPRVLLQADEWYSSMWVSPTGHHFLCEILGGALHDLAGTFTEDRLPGGRLFRIWGLHDRAVYTVGENGRCFRFDGRGWTDFSAGLQGYVHAIGGTAENALFAAGDYGFVARSSGGAWQPVAIPANPDIRFVLALGPDKAFFCGLRGGCFLLDGDVYQPITVPGDASLYAIAEYRGDYYFGSLEHGIFKLDGTALVPFKPQARGYDMVRGDRFLFTCGLGQVARFDGTGWFAVPFT
jgi:hypothetical protein